MPPDLFDIDDPDDSKTRRDPVSGVFTDPNDSKKPGKSSWQVKNDGVKRCSRCKRALLEGR